jgi:hypothetical protein
VWPSQSPDHLASLYYTVHPTFTPDCDWRLSSELKRSFFDLQDSERQTNFYVISASSLNTHNLLVDCLQRLQIMHSVIYLVGLVVVVLFILSALGLR